MGRTHAVDNLPLEQREWLLQKLVRCPGAGSREISCEFQQQFHRPLAKSSLARWRQAAGNELADRYAALREVASQLKQDLHAEDADSYALILRTIEDRMLTAQAELFEADPLKLLVFRQEEGRQRIQQAGLDLQRERIQLDREKLKGVALDRGKLAAEFLADLLEFIGSDAEGLRWFKKSAKPFETFVNEKYAAAT